MTVLYQILDSFGYNGSFSRTGTLPERAAVRPDDGIASLCDFVKELIQTRF